MREPERDRALLLAGRVLERPNADPDEDIAVLARQLNRAQEEIDRLHNTIVQIQAAAQVVRQSLEQALSEASQ